MISFNIAEFLLPFCSSTSNWQYLGGPVAQNMTDEKERNRLATRARCLCARMLGKLACYIAMPAPGIDYSREPSTPIEMFVEKVLLPSMQCRCVHSILIVKSFSCQAPKLLDNNYDERLQ